MVMSGGNAIYGNQVYQVSMYGGGTLMADHEYYGRRREFFSDDDVLSKSQVVVIGYKVKDHLFDGDEAIGQKIRIGNNTFKVIGVLPQKGASGLINFDDAVIMPYTTAQTYVLGINYFNRIIVEADTQDHINATAADITNTLRSDHNITDPTQDDFSVETSADIASTLSTVTSALTAFLAAVAAISLVVGGIGIMNIMFVSVTERTREIGLRKALGACDHDILMQFLLEAVMLTATGDSLAFSSGDFFHMSFRLSLPACSLSIGLLFFHGVQQFLVSLLRVWSD